MIHQGFAAPDIRHFNEVVNNRFRVICESAMCGAGSRATRLGALHRCEVDQCTFIGIKHVGSIEFRQREFSRGLFNRVQRCRIIGP
jgi:hypothetical protein